MTAELELAWGPEHAGVDEAGRGPLAGPVYAAAVMLDPARPIPGLMDSKQLSADRREALEQVIMTNALGWAVGCAEVEEIDRINILQASLLAMRRAVLELPQAPSLVWVDGKQCPQLQCPARAVVNGDQLIPPISAASILAKVARDRVMQALDAQYPEYGFGVHKGYPTRAHLLALQRHGVSPIHRRSYRPVRELIGVT